MDIHSTLDAALALPEQGIPVMPLVPGEKRPSTRNGVYDATYEPGQIQKWWMDNPSAGPRQRDGRRSGLVVVDVDMKNGVDGLSSLKGWMHQYGELPVTSRVETPSKGLHLYFAVRRDDDAATSVTWDEVDRPASVGNKTGLASRRRHPW